METINEFRFKLVSQITHDLDIYISCQLVGLGLLSEREHIEILRIFQQTLRRSTLYGSNESGAISQKVQGDNRRDVQLNLFKKS